MDKQWLIGANVVCTDWVVVFSAWQEVVQQEQGPSQGPEEAQGAVHYKDTTPSPHMDSEYSFSSSSQFSSDCTLLFKQLRFSGYNIIVNFKAELSKVFM